MRKWQKKSLMNGRQDTLKVSFILVYSVISPEILAQVSSANFTPITDHKRKLYQNIDRWVSRVSWSS